MEKNDFKRDLDELVRLFSLLKDRSDKQEIYGFDKSYLQNLEMFIKSYNIAREGITEDMVEQLGQMGKPMSDMIRQMITQLREELGEDLYGASHLEEMTEKKDLAVKSRVEVAPTRMEIDRMLLLPNISEEEINKLLDHRAKIID